MAINPAVKPTFGSHFDGCSKSIGLEAISGTVKFDNFSPFHSDDPWGFHIHKTKHCKHHIHVTRGLGNIIVDGRPLSGTNFPSLSCGIATNSPAVDIILVP